MSVLDIPIIPRWGRYHRHLEGSDFSMEANTEQSPEPGRFYLLSKGKVVLDSRDFLQVQAAYKDLCREFWESRLVSDQAAVRIACAWGLLGIDPKHPLAAEIIRADGSEGDQRRMESNRRREKAENWRKLRARKRAAP